MSGIIFEHFTSKQLLRFGRHPSGRCQPKTLLKFVNVDDKQHGIRWCPPNTMMTDFTALQWLCVDHRLTDEYNFNFNFTHNIRMSHVRITWHCWCWHSGLRLRLRRRVAGRPGRSHRRRGAGGRSVVGYWHGSPRRRCLGRRRRAPWRRQRARRRHWPACWWPRYGSSHHAKKMAAAFLSTRNYIVCNCCELLLPKLQHQPVTANPSQVTYPPFPRVNGPRETAPVRLPRNPVA